MSAINFLKTWAENYWSDFSENAELFTILQGLVDEFATLKLILMLSTVIKRKVDLILNV
jgi:hypothetical protein